MKQINLAAYADGNAASPTELPPRIAANATVAVPGQREVRQFSATVWIVAAWLIASLAWELQVLGAEPQLAVPVAGNLVAQKSMLQQWEARATEFAITHSGIVEFDRIQRDSKLRPTIRAIIDQAEPSTTDIAAGTSTNVTETAATSPSQSVQTEQPLPPESKQNLASQPEQPQDALDRRDQPIADSGQPETNPTSVPDEAPAPTSDREDPKNIELAYEESAAPGEDHESAEQTRQAWMGVPPGTIPDLVELVVHSFNELMTPVHVRPLASDRSVVNVADNPASAAGPVTFVETDSQGESAVNSSAAGDAADSGEETIEVIADANASAPPRNIGSPPLTKPIVVTRNPHDVIRIDQQVETPQIVRSRPQLLRVPEHSVMITAPAAELAADSQPELPVEEPAAAAKQPVTQLAAKWPFERNQPATSSGVSLNVDDADVRTVFEMLARGYQMNILVAPEVEGVVTANVEGLSPEQTLQGIVKMCGLSMQQDEQMIYIYSADKIPADARELRVFPLDFARASTIEATIQGLLSPVGNAYPSMLNNNDNLQTQESIVVVDIPPVIEQVADYILQADQPPRQVVIEARVLEVELSDDMMHGVNFDAFSRRLNLKVGSHGLADPVASSANPLFFAQIEGAELNGLLDLLETTTDSKTLASPRVQVINGQNARIQVGQQLGFTVATVTQTSTIQDVQFLETGVVLSVTPTISRDNRILMQVKPEVSDGVINPDTLLPEEETREVETSVLLDNHQGVIIGGLIQEKDRTVIKKLPWLGDVKHVGKFFQRREAIRSRSEIIVALIPHIVDQGVQDERSIIDYERTETPLLQGVLQRTCRPWEPRLPDRVGEEKHLDVNRLNRKLP